MALLPNKNRNGKAAHFSTGPCCFMFIMSIILSTLLVLVSATAQAETSLDYRALPPFISTSVKPNVLLVLDNSNSMDEDVDGAAVGSNAANSKSEIARNALKTIIDGNKATMRFGLMAYKQTGIVKQEIHNSFYYCDYSSAHYDSNLNPSTPKDPLTNKKRFPNPTDSGGSYIYYDTALPFYSTNDEGIAFCYSKNDSDTYACYHKKTGDAATPAYASATVLTNYGYSNLMGNFSFYPTDSDLAAGFTHFGREMSWVHVGPTWFANTSPGPGMLYSRIQDSDTAHITELKDLLGTSQFVVDNDKPLRNAGLTPLAGTMVSAQKYFKGTLAGTEDSKKTAPASPIQYSCQQNYVVLVTDGLPSVKADGTIGSTDALIAELSQKIKDIRTTSVSAFNTNFDIKTYVIGFAIPPEFGDKLDSLAVAGGTAVGGKALLANNAAELADELENIFLQINNQTSSGTASSVISGSRSGEGAVYQSIFYPEYSDHSTPENKISWAGSVHASFVDSLGRIREDTNHNRILDVEDKIIVFRKPSDAPVVIDKYSLVAAKSEATKLTLPAATLLANKYFFLNTVSEKFYVWFNVDGNGKDPRPTLDRTGVTVAVSNADTANNVATKTAAALSALKSSFTVSTPTTNAIIITNNLSGDVADATPETSGVTINVSNQGTGETEHLDFTTGAEDIEYLWNSTSWLNGITDADIKVQRSYNTVAQKRYIFTFIDENQNEIADPGEQRNFVAPSPILIGDLMDPRTIYPYLTLNSDSKSFPSYVSSANAIQFSQIQTQRIINYIRGQDQASQAISGGTLPAFRSRKLDLDHNGSLETTWRLGDIVYSSPTAVSKPQEAFHLLYKDASYGIFAEKYKQRRTVIYTGANDGMMHAFNGGFYENRFDVYPTDADRINDVQFLLQPKDADGTPITSGIAAHPLGAELWAYVPYNLLPHLYWLTEPNYGHVYYVDLKPRIFDAKIFPADTDHPGGWGTVLVGGMRFGGGKMTVDMNRLSRFDGVADRADRTMASAYFVLDITNPEKPPQVLSEFNFPGLGYTTCFPTVAAIKDRSEMGTQNRWFLIFGSGPAEADGSPGKASQSSLSQAISNQSAKLYVVDLNEMVTSKVLKTLDEAGSLSSVSATDPGYYKMFVEDGKNAPYADNNAFITDPVTADFDLDYRADVVYFGTVSYDANANNVTNRWGGKLRRIVLDKGGKTNKTIDPTDPTSWNGDSVLIDLETTLHQPITAAPAIGVDPDGNNWVFFGTGRYFTRDDALITDQETFYGIKEPRSAVSASDSTIINSYATVLPPTDIATRLYDSTNIEVSTSTKLVTGGGWTGATWGKFLSDTKGMGGWYYNFEHNFISNPNRFERNVSQAALVGDLLTFTSFIPSNDVCKYDGDSYLYGLYYLTGTAPYNPALRNVLILNPVNHIKRMYLGPGLASKASVHVGEKDGSTAFVQNSDGSVIPIEQANPGLTKSGRTGWAERD